jgi:hypothetical protein
MLADGTGPAIVQLSPRRIGILESDLINWMAARRRALGCRPKEVEPTVGDVAA